MRQGQTSTTAYLVLRSVSTGAPRTGLTAADAVIGYVRPGGEPVWAAAVTLASPGAAFAANGFCEVDAANLPGVYRVDFPDAAFAAGVRDVALAVRPSAAAFGAVIGVEPLADAPGASGLVVLRQATLGGPATGLVDSDAKIGYLRAGSPAVWADAVALAAVNAPYAANGFIEIDPATLPGVYRVDWPAAALAAGADRALLTVAPRFAAFAATTVVAELVDATLLPVAAQVLHGVSFGDRASPHLGTLTAGGTTGGEPRPPRVWESIICYEDRAQFHTSRWRLWGINTKLGAQNTDSGVLWLVLSRDGDMLTATLYKDDDFAPESAVAAGTADVSGVDGTAASAEELELSPLNDSGISGSFWIHRLTAEGVCPLQVALCTDDDLDGLWDGIESLAGYSATFGMAEFIRLAGEDVLARVTRLLEDSLGAAAAEAWFITDADRTYPDLRRLANPGQLRLTCAYRVLQLALGRQHDRADDTAFSVLRDSFGREYENAIKTIRVAFRGGGRASGTTSFRRQARA